MTFLAHHAQAWAIRQAVLERRSVRSFLPHPLSRSVVAELLRDTLWAPSPHNSQPWRFTALFDAAAKAGIATAMAARLIADLTAEGASSDEAERQAQRSRNRISSAPVVVLCSITREGLVWYHRDQLDELEWQMAVQSVGAALQTLFLLAWERGIGACWMAAPMYCPEVVRETLSLPVEYSPQALILLGYPAHPGKVRARRPADEVIELR